MDNIHIIHFNFYISLIGKMFVCVFWEEYHMLGSFIVL